MMDLDLKGGLSNADFQMMLDAAAGAGNNNNDNNNGTGNGNGNGNGESSFDQASLQRQVKLLPFLSPFTLSNLEPWTPIHSPFMLLPESGKVGADAGT